jgi:hypothetical protein
MSSANSRERAGHWQKDCLKRAAACVMVFGKVIRSVQRTGPERQASRPEREATKPEREATRLGVGRIVSSNDRVGPEAANRHTARNVQRAIFPRVGSLNLFAILNV